jgi:hypothetical protein
MTGRLVIVKQIFGGGRFLGMVHLATARYWLKLFTPPSD